MNKARYIIIFLWIMLMQSLSSQEMLGEITRKPIATIQQVHFNSKALGQEVEMNVYLPISYDITSEKHKYPVIVLLENEFFYQITGIVKHLSSVDRMPESIVISFPKGFNKSYAPKLYTNGSKFWPSDWKQMPFDGNPDHFTDFFKSEVFTLLSQQYKVANYNIVLGTSATAVYPLHAFCKEPGLFQGHIAISAGDMLSMGYTPETTLIETIVERIEQDKNPKKGLYVCSSQSDIENTAEIGDNLLKMKDKLSPFTTYRVKSEINENETHYGVVIPAFISAMNTFFTPKDWDVDFRNFETKDQNPLKNIDAYYKKMSEKYGFDIFPRTNRWNSGSSLQASGRRLLRQKRNKEALEIYQRIIEYTPNAPGGYYDISKAYKLNNQKEKALEAIKKAIHIAERSKDERLISTYKKYQQELEVE